MIHKFDKLAISLPTPDGPDANAASCVQELLGGKFGEMSTLMNYTFQSFNFREWPDELPDMVRRTWPTEYPEVGVSCFGAKSRKSLSWSRSGLPKAGTMRAREEEE